MGSELMLEILIPRWKGLKHSWLARGPGVDYVWVGERCHYRRVCVCVCVCVCVMLDSWNAQLEQLKSFLGHPFKLPRSPLTCLSLFFLPLP